jgi:hypothetical protein
LERYSFGGGGRMKKLIQILIVCGIFVVMGGTAIGFNGRLDVLEVRDKGFTDTRENKLGVWKDCKIVLSEEEKLKETRGDKELRWEYEEECEDNPVSKKEAAEEQRIADNAMKGVKPERQKEFLSIVKTHADKYAKGKSEIKKSLYRKKRMKAFSKYFAATTCFKTWVGTVKSLDTDKNGDAMLSIDIGGFNYLNYGPAAIPMSNPLFDTVAEMEENDKVVLSGCFKKHNDTFADNWYLFTHEKTENGAMTSPTFQGSYRDIKKIN